MNASRPRWGGPTGIPDHPEQQFLCDAVKVKDSPALAGMCQRSAGDVAQDNPLERDPTALRTGDLRYTPRRAERTFYVSGDH